MDFGLTAVETNWRDRVREHILRFLRPRESDYHLEQSEEPRWKVLPVVQQEKERAKSAGLWNLFMPPAADHSTINDDVAFRGPGLTNLQYALCAEEMGRIEWASEVFNCSAPDTGNMEVLHRYGTRSQKERWLAPLMRGEIRSTFLMTEPAVASSDATNIATSIRLDGEHYVINGR